MPHLVSVRFRGDLGCWTRPEMKTERCSYPVMTPSGARGALEAVYREPEMLYLIDSIRVLKRGRWISFRRNEVEKVISLENARKWMGGAPVTPLQAGGGAQDGTQRNTLALAEVDYVVTAEVRLTPRARPPRDSLGKYVELVRRRASAGKCTHRPYLGCREFAADFEWVEDPQALRPEAAIEREDLGLMLYDVFDPVDRTGPAAPGKPSPVFFHAVIEHNRIECHPERVAILRGAGGEV
jgi:CRISPR-associated protein Cas5d